MSSDESECTVCGDIAIHEIPTVLCDACFANWIEYGDWVIDPGCPVASKLFNEHISNCDECCADYRLCSDLPLYCPVGESLEETWADSIDYGDE